jgi:hypothetical protein
VPLTPGVPIRIEATVADVTIVGSNRPDVLVEIVRHAPTSADLAKYPVVIEDRRDGLHVTVLQAPVRGEPGRDANLRTVIAIAAPATAVFQAVRVFEGRVTVTNLKTAVDVDLRRGPIDATALAGRVRLETGIGSIDVKDSALTPGGMMRLRVFNGPLRVRFARAGERADSGGHVQRHDYVRYSADEEGSVRAALRRDDDRRRRSGDVDRRGHRRYRDHRREMISRMIIVPVSSASSDAFGCGEISVIDSNCPSRSRQPRATRTRRPPYNRDSANRSYGPALPNASSGSSVSIVPLRLRDRLDRIDYRADLVTADLRVGGRKQRGHGWIARLDRLGMARVLSRPQGRRPCLGYHY